MIISLHKKARKYVKNSVTDEIHNVINFDRFLNSTIQFLKVNYNFSHTIFFMNTSAKYNT